MKILAWFWLLFLLVAFFYGVITFCGIEAFLRGVLLVGFCFLVGSITSWAMKTISGL